MLQVEQELCVAVCLVWEIIYTIMSAMLGRSNVREPIVSSRLVVILQVVALAAITMNQQPEMLQAVGLVAVIGVGVVMIARQGRLYLITAGVFIYLLSAKLGLEGRKENHSVIAFQAATVVVHLALALWQLRVAYLVLLS